MVSMHSVAQEKGLDALMQDSVVLMLLLLRSVCSEGCSWDLVMTLHENFHRVVMKSNSQEGGNARFCE